MMWALIFGGRVVQVEPESGTFPVHPSLAWVACPAEVSVGWGWDGLQFAPPEPDEVAS